MPPVPSPVPSPRPPGLSARRRDASPPVAMAGLAAVLLGVGLSLEAAGPFAFDPAAALRGVAGQLGTTLPAAILISATTGLNVAAGLVLMRVGLARPFWGAGSAVLAGFVGAVLLDIVLLGALGGTGTFTWPFLVAVHVAILGGGHLLRDRIGPVLAPPAPWAVGPAEASRPADARVGAGAADGDVVSARGTDAVASAAPTVTGSPALAADAGGGRLFERLPWSGRLGPRPGWWQITPWWPFWLAIAVLCVGLVALQLASPVVPFVDVLPNHVAPVEHLRTFGDFASVTTTASPIYGPSRTFLGYAALLGVVDTLAMLPAVLGVAAFAIPGAVFVALGVHRLATAIGGGRAGAWAVLAFVLTTSFVRLPDARATVLVLPLSGWALAEIADRLAGREPPELRRSLLLGAALAAAILVHPVIGALTLVSAGLVLAGWPGRTREQLVPALAAAVVLALPQLAAMTERSVPTAAALVAIPAAVVVAWVPARSAAVRWAILALGRIGIVLGLLYVLIGEASPEEVWDAAYQGMDKLLPTIPVLLLTTLAGVVVATRRVVNPVLLAVLASGVVAATATGLVPGGGTFQDALRFEVPKTLHYWVPLAFVLAAGIALDAAWSDGQLPPVVPRLVAVAWLAVAILPIRGEQLTDAYHLGERRVAETVSLQLHYAETGYWTGYPDSRRIIVPEQQAIVDAVRAEISAGRLGARDEVLHVARSFQQWSAVPLGVFAGVVETDITPDAEVSIHTVGGRLRPYAALSSLLAGDARYLVLELGGLPADVRARVEAAGFRSIFASARGEVFRRGG